MSTVAWITLFGGLSVPLYSLAGYPLLLGLAGRRKRRAAPPPSTEGSAPFPPPITVVLPAHNEEARLPMALDAILNQDYPRDRLRVVVVSDASTDRTDAIALERADQGVRLLRIRERSGKDRCEEEALGLLEGPIVVNTDASVRLRPGALRALVAPFIDPGVGVASSTDVPVGPEEGPGLVRPGGRRSASGEAGYVRGEMLLRALETRAGGIVGASGSLYAIRSALHRRPVPPGLSRDFSAPLTARRFGYRSVSVPEALCEVPVTRSLRREFRRKVRTLNRGMHTLFAQRDLMDPRRHGLFAWKLVSHKVTRWATPWGILIGSVSAAAVDPPTGWAGLRWAPLGGVALALATGALAWAWEGPDGRPVPRALRIPGGVVLSLLAVLIATLRFASGRRDATWEPTRR